MTAELHHLSRFAGLRQWALDWLGAVALVGALLAVYAVVDLYNEAVQARAELEQRKAVACPLELHGQQFAFSAYERVNLARPGTAKLVCFYRGRA